MAAQALAHQQRTTLTLQCCCKQNMFQAQDRSGMAMPEGVISRKPEAGFRTAIWLIFWAADATCLPYTTQSLLLGRQLLDCHVPATSSSCFGLLNKLVSPALRLVDKSREYAQWIGGHSSASDWRETRSKIHSLFQPNGPVPEPGSAEIFSEHPNLPWRVPCTIVPDAVFCSRILYVWLIKDNHELSKT